MRLRMAFLVAVLALAQGSAAPVLGDSSSWVDLQADNITIEFPAPGVIEITAHYSIRNNMDRDTLIDSDVTFTLDGVVRDAQPIEVTRALNDCRRFHTKADCKGECYPRIGPPPLDIGDCVWVEPPPWDTLLGGCQCEYKGNVKSTIPYSGEAVASITLDPGNAVSEPWEDNNSFVLALGPVPTKPMTWTRVKIIYR